MAHETYWYCWELFYAKRTNYSILFLYTTRKEYLSIWKSRSFVKFIYVPSILEWGNCRWLGIKWNFYRKYFKHLVVIYLSRPLHGSSKHCNFIVANLHLKNLAAQDRLGEMRTQAFHNYTLWPHGDYDLLLFASRFINLVSSPEKHNHLSYKV